MSFFLIVSVFLTACKPPPSQKILAMGTFCSINLFHDGRPELYKRLFDRIIQLENKFSVNIPASEISRVNESAGKSAVKVSDETFFVTKAALDAAYATDGAFNPLILPLTRLWNVSGLNPKVPTEAEIFEAKSHCDYRTIILNENERSIFLQDEKSAMDLGGITKGFVCDELRKILVEENVKNAVLNLGGNVFIFGKNPEKKDWQVAIRDPFSGEGAALVVFLEEGSVVTSGDYERFFEKDGEVFHHIIHWKTGYPSRGDLKSVSILSQKSMVADILSTAFFVMGWDESLKFLENREKYPSLIPDDVQVLAITKDKKVLTSKNFHVKITKNEFR